MKWKTILTDDDKPNYYHGVKIIIKGIVYNGWHRLSSDDGDEYYGSINTDVLLDSQVVTHWSELDTEKRSVLIEKIPI